MVKAATKEARQIVAAGDVVAVTCTPNIGGKYCASSSFASSTPNSATAFVPADAVMQARGERERAYDHSLHALFVRPVRTCVKSAAARGYSSSYS